jgi:hypothetical protein
MFDCLTLVVPEKHDSERDAVCEVWLRHGGTILRLGRFWEPPSLERSTVRLYGPETFCLVLAQKLRLALVSPDDALLARFAPELLQRRLIETSLSAATSAQLDFPAFIKPVVPKIFRAAVYDTLAYLEEECEGLSPDTRILVSELVPIAAEARAFVLDGSMMTIAIYEGNGDLADAVRTAKVVARNPHLPTTCVIDLALIENRGWAVLELNATWGSGLNGCDALGGGEMFGEGGRTDSGSD